MRLYAHVMPVCSIDAPAVSGVVLELWPSVWHRDAKLFLMWTNASMLLGDYIETNDNSVK